LQVKGKSVGLGIYTVLDNTKSHFTVSKKYHDQMHQQYRDQDFDGAIETINKIYSGFDGRMQGYYDMWIDRCEYMKKQDLPSDWSGIFVATSK